MARHEFALFTPVAFEKGSSLTLTDGDTLRRMTSIVRLRLEDQVQLFNRKEAIRGTVKEIGKKNIILEVVERVILQSLTPPVTVLLPTLKRDDFQEALSRLCALGVTTIQCVTTQKVQHSWDFTRDKDRFERVMIAAAEQSKQLVLPQLIAPCSLQDALTHLEGDSQRIFFDPEGQSLIEVVQQLKTCKGETVLCVGPEGDLTDEEKDLLKSFSFTFCALTPTVLRACEAVALGAGIVRSLVR